MSFLLRRLYQNEMERAAIIHRTAFADRFPWLAAIHTPDEDRDYFRDHVFADYEVWGAIDVEMIGFVAFCNGWVDQLYVLPDRQRQGAGHALLEVAKAASFSLSLWTLQRNVSARRFYEMHGFVMLKETDGLSNDEHEPDVLYRWQRAAADLPALPEPSVCLLSAGRTPRS